MQGQLAPAAIHHIWIRQSWDFLNQGWMLSKRGDAVVEGRINLGRSYGQAFNWTSDWMPKTILSGLFYESTWKAGAQEPEASSLTDVMG